MNEMLVSAVQISYDPRFGKMNN